jgi:hypothetical protein
MQSSSFTAALVVLAGLLLVVSAGSVIMSSGESDVLTVERNDSIVVTVEQGSYINLPAQELEESTGFPGDIKITNHRGEVVQNGEDYDYDARNLTVTPLTCMETNQSSGCLSHMTDARIDYGYEARPSTLTQTQELREMMATAMAYFPLLAIPLAIMLLLGGIVSSFGRNNLGGR